METSAEMANLAGKQILTVINVLWTVLLSTHRLKSCHLPGPLSFLTVTWSYEICVELMDSLILGVLYQCQTPNLSLSAGFVCLVTFKLDYNSNGLRHKTNRGLLNPEDPLFTWKFPQKKELSTFWANNFFNCAFQVQLTKLVGGVWSIAWGAKGVQLHIYYTAKSLCNHLP